MISRRPKSAIGEDDAIKPAAVTLKVNSVTHVATPTTQIVGIHNARFRHIEGLPSKSGTATGNAITAQPSPLTSIAPRQKPAYRTARDRLGWLTNLANAIAAAVAKRVRGISAMVIEVYICTIGLVTNNA